MRMPALRRQWSACRASVLLLLTTASTAYAADRVTGTVVDQSQRPLPRALVRVVDDTRELATAFTDELGSFDVAASSAGRCRIEASLTGFATASVDCRTPAPIRVVLGVAPVQETVVVTATRTEAPAAQVGASVTTFTSADLERRRTPLVADVLRASPGAMLVRTGAPGAVTSLFVRGGESSYNKVLVDGIPLNEPGGTFFFNNLTTENLERIEIVRGAQSALFGSDAMSSVVQLFTKRPDPGAKPSGQALFEGGSYGTFHGSASAAGRSGRLEYSVGAARFSSDNRDPNSGFNNTTLSANVGTSIGDAATLRVITRGELGHNGVPGQTAFARPDLDAFAERHDGLVGVVFDQQATPILRQRAMYSLAVSNQQSTNLIVDPPYVARYQDRTGSFTSNDFLYDNRTKLHRHHASYQADIRLANDANRGSQLTTLLVDWDGERATLQDLRANTATTPSRDNSGFSVQHQAVWRRFVLTGSGRVEHNASFGTAAVPRASVVFVAHESTGEVGATRLHASAGAGIKEPTLLQSFSPSPFFHGNPDLLPERSRSVEVGVDQRLASERAQLSLTWFDNRYKNLISLRTTNPVTFEAEYFNIGLTRARGMELAADVAPVTALRARAGYTLLDSEILESTSPFSAVLRQGQQLFRRPRHSGFAEIAWNRDRIAASLTGVFIGRFVDSDFASLQPPILEHPSYSTWDARLSFRARSQAAVLLSIDNLADADYMEPLGYRALRRAVRAGVRVGF